jgi:hypothetical protein
MVLLQYLDRKFNLLNTSKFVSHEFVRAGIKDGIIIVYTKRDNSLTDITADIKRMLK